MQPTFGALIVPLEGESGRASSLSSHKGPLQQLPPPGERLDAAGTQAGTSPVDALRTRHPGQSCLSPSHSRPPPRVASGRRGCLRVLLA